MFKMCGPNDGAPHYGNLLKKITEPENRWLPAVARIFNQDDGRLTGTTAP